MCVRRFHANLFFAQVYFSKISFFFASQTKHLTDLFTIKKKGKTNVFILPNTNNSKHQSWQMIFLSLINFIVCFFQVCASVNSSHFLTVIKKRNWLIPHKLFPPKFPIQSWLPIRGLNFEFFSHKVILHILIIFKKL